MVSVDPDHRSKGIGNPDDGRIVGAATLTVLVTLVGEMGDDCWPARALRLDPKLTSRTS